ncbi:MAG: hypothetical protein ACYDD6_13170, partial [Acidimicrobiales bacterium]
MASGFFKRSMVYLGLVDDDYEDYEDYEPGRGLAPRVATRAADDEVQQPAQTITRSTIRPLREDGSGTTPSVRPMVRPLPADAAARVHVVAPMQFGDARQIADRLMGNQP